MKLKKRNIFAAMCGIFASSGAIAYSAQIDVFNDATLTENSTAGLLGTNIRVIKADQTWTADNQYILTDRVYIPNGVTLTIEPGTKIYGSFNDNGTTSDKTDDKVGSLIATRGGRLVAEGTACKPIVFTSIRELEAQLGVDSPFDPDTVVGPAPTTTDGAQWGGVVLLGTSYVLDVDATGKNKATDTIEGFIDKGSVSNDGDLLPDAIQYGPSTGFPLDLADDSGSLRYVSIRHGGYEFATAKEINGLTLGGVGSGTTIEFVEVYANSDDGIEFFGGTVATNNIVMAFNQDDSFDIDEGHKATHQFWFAIQNPGIADNGGEWDGVDGSSTGFNLLDAIGNQSKPIIYNATFVGPGADLTATLIADKTGEVLTEKGNRAFLIEDRFNGELYNAIVHDFSEGLVKFNDNAASVASTAVMRNIVIGSFGDGTGAVLGDEGSLDNPEYVTNTNPGLFFDGSGDAIDGNTDGGTDPMFTAYTRNASNNKLTYINPIPAPGSPALTLGTTSGAPVAAAYRGAFGTENWMECWTKFSDFTKPQIDVFADTDITENSTAGLLGTNIRVIKNSQTWTADNHYILTDRVYIPNGVTLTIEPGTKIFGSFNDNGTAGDKTDDKVGALIATRGGRLVAEGTVDNPIVFTSLRALEALQGVDSPFDPDSDVGPAPSTTDGAQWGGVVLLGTSYVLDVDATGKNKATDTIEGFIDKGSVSNDGDLLPDAIQYGPSTGFPLDLADDSGSLRYVSIRHGGYEFATAKEINGLTLGGVGSGTTIEFVEVYANSDDGIEFFGGTVATNNIVMAFNQDDSFDIDEGHKATHQFWFAIQNPGIADNGGEWDGVDGSSTGFNLLDAIGNQSKPIIYNATFVGPGADLTATLIADKTGEVLTEKGNRAFLIEDRFNGELYNAIVHDFSEGLVKFNDNAASVASTAVMRNIVIGSFGDGTGAVLGDEGSLDNPEYVTNTNPGLFFDGSGDAIDGNTDGGTDPMFTAYTRNASNNKLININPIPAPGSPALTLDVTLGAPVAAPYRGAFGSENWTACWTHSGAMVSGVAPEEEAGGEPPFVDSDNDGIDDALEITTALADLGFVVGNNDAALFASLYDEDSILDLRTTAGVTVEKVGDTATLSVPVEKSTGLDTWEDAGELELEVDVTGEDAQFFRLEVQGAN